MIRRGTRMATSRLLRSVAAARVTAPAAVGSKLSRWPTVSYQSTPRRTFVSRTVAPMMSIKTVDVSDANGKSYHPTHRRLRI